jgi:aryl-alcohol dehydrogenase-like predicted oxidoreductase
MPLRQIYVPSLRRSLSNLMGAPSSSKADTHEAGLDAYHRLGGNAIHLHGEGGEIHSRRMTGDWLRRHGIRQDFFLCTQICHDDWDDATQQTIDRFTPEAVHHDIALDLQLLGTDYLDLVYLDDRPDLGFEAVVEALGREIASGRIRALGVRNWTADRIRDAHSYAMKAIGQGIAAVVTTELSLFASAWPLWPEYIPFDAKIEQVVRELGLAVFAHAGDYTLGQCLFGDEDALARMRPEWVQRWQLPVNADLARHVREIAEACGSTPREIQLAWLLNREFPVLAIVDLPTLLTDIGLEYERGSQSRLADTDLRRLESHQT